MEARKASATEEAGAVPVAPSGAAGESEAKDSPRQFLTLRNLTEEEAASAAGVRWLQYEVERLDREAVYLKKENQKLRETNDNLLSSYSDMRVDVEVLKGRNRFSLRNEILSYLCVTAGAAGLSTAPGYYSIQGIESFVTAAMVVSGALVLGGLFLRVWKMSIRFSRVANSGTLGKERVILIAEADGDIGQYALFRARASKKTGRPLAGQVPHVWWFMQKDVKRGDFVVLYTKEGTRSEKKNEGGSTSHFFYWGLTNPLWIEGFVPVLVETPEWEIGTI